MKDIDELIKETLSQEEIKFYDELDEQNLFEMVKGLFTAKFKWIMIAMNIVQIIAFGLFVYCIIQFLGTDNTNELIKWLGAGFVCAMVSVIIKLFSWMQMNNNAILREMKRLELQMSSIAGKISK